MPRTPEYLAIADLLKQRIMDGEFDDGVVPFPSTVELADLLSTTTRTTGRAVQHLVGQGLLIARPGQAAVVVPPELRATEWPSTGRYARARAAQGLLFSRSHTDIRKETVSVEWVDADPLIVRLLGIEPGQRVLRRVSRTYTAGSATPVEHTAMHFPASVVADAPELETAPAIRVVAMIEATGRTIDRTHNRIAARLATELELATFGLDGPAAVVDHTHATLSATGEPVEAVINIRPASGNVITFDTYEGPAND